MYVLHIFLVILHLTFTLRVFLVIVFKYLHCCVLKKYREIL